MTHPIRKPAVAGQFYPANPGELEAELSRLVETVSKKIPAKGIIVPHAGYVYSGRVAGEVYERIEIPDRLIILSPNHTGLGVPFSVMARGFWRLPLGDVQIDEDLATRLMKEFPAMEEDSLAHMREHSLEVQIPFLQYLKESFTFVPLTIGHVSFGLCQQLGEAIARVVKKTGSSVLIIASSDMNHYENQETTLHKDEEALKEILKCDPEGLYGRVHEKNISMCGIIPATVMLTACNELGAKKAELVAHRTSGDVNKDYSAVVGYAGVIIS